jgi:hypothetical protein
MCRDIIVVPQLCINEEALSAIGPAPDAISSTTHTSVECALLVLQGNADDQQEDAHKQQAQSRQGMRSQGTGSSSRRAAGYKGQAGAHARLNMELPASAGLQSNPAASTPAPVSSSLNASTSSNSGSVASRVQGPNTQGASTTSSPRRQLPNWAAMSMLAGGSAAAAHGQYGGSNIAASSRQPPPPAGAAQPSLAASASAKSSSSPAEYASPTSSSSSQGRTLHSTRKLGGRGAHENSGVNEVSRMPEKLVRDWMRH